MHRIDTDGATGGGLFQDGNPAIGQRATQVDAAWLNGVQETIAHTIETAGIVLAKGDASQLTDAIVAMIAGAGVDLSGFALLSQFNATVASEGSQRLSSGIIIKWGHGVQAGAGGATPIVFPAPFPNALFNAIATNDANGPPTASHGCGGFSKNGMTVWSASSSGVAAAPGVAFFWWAIGH